jgi:low affinity Fe/Cu permease
MGCRLRVRQGLLTASVGPIPVSQGAETGMNNNVFDRITTGCARFAGRPLMLAACIALAVIGLAAYASGNDHFINGANLSISIVTLLLLPILQATQNRDGAALQAKIDELIRSHAEARDAMIGLERRGEDEIEEMRPAAPGKAECD